MRRRTINKVAAEATEQKQDDDAGQPPTQPPRKSTDIGPISRPMLLFLCTGIAMSLIGQINANKGLADARAQLISWIKYLSALVSNAVALHYSTDAVYVNWGTRQLLYALAFIDVVAYALFVHGFNMLGASVSTIIFAGLSQFFTALLTVTLLHRKLSRLQTTGVGIVILGLCMQSAPAFLSTLTNALTTTSVTSAGHPLSGGGVSWSGVLSVVGSTLLYALMGVVYEQLLAVRPTPPHTMIMFTISAIGFTCTSIYMLIYTLPRWSTVVLAPIHNAGTSWPMAFCCWLAFAVVYNAHTYTQRLVFSTDGALGGCLVNALRGPAVSVVVALFFCSASTPKHCLTGWGVGSACMVAVGVYVWGISKDEHALWWWKQFFKMDNFSW